MRISHPSALLLPLLLSACGGYASNSQIFRRSLGEGRPKTALAAVNKALGVDRAEDLPSRPEADTPLLLLERATILQSMQRYQLSARDFQAADAKLEVLDLSQDTAGEIGKYLFSGDATLYKSPPHEKLLLSTLNMCNYLARGDLSGAKVEARRFLVNRKYLKDQEEGRGMIALGSYLAGFSFEMARESAIAMRHYGDAYEKGSMPSLDAAIRALAARSGAQDPRLKALIEENSSPPNDVEEAEVLILIQTGMAPYLVPKRIPIGLALGAASGPGRGARLNAKQRRRASTLSAKGALKWVNYPSLRRVRSRPNPPALFLDGRRLETGIALNVEAKVIEQHEANKGSLIASAITRLISRAIAGELGQAVGKKASKSGVAGLLIGLVIEGAMTAADTPDTRSWVSLPARFSLARLRLPAGAHHLALRRGGQESSQSLKLQPGGWAFINFSALR